MIMNVFFIGGMYIKGQGNKRISLVLVFSTIGNTQFCDLDTLLCNLYIFAAEFYKTSEKLCRVCLDVFLDYS